MQLTTFLTATFTLIGMAAANPMQSSNLAFSKLNARACDCAGVIACCQTCLRDAPNSVEGEKCCNTTCMTKFPGCESAC